MRILLIFAVCSFAWAQDIAKQAEDYVQSYARDGVFRGVVLVAKDGQPLFRKGFGLANEEWSIPNTPETRFRLGSITKQFTAAAILQLAESGKLQLTDPISKYYTDAPAAWEKITIHHLLNHTSGIRSYTGLPDFFPKQSRDARKPAEIVMLTQNMPLEFDPGTRFAYNNTGYILLGYVIEKVSGLSYSDYLDKNVFPRAGMNDSGYDMADKIIPRRASGYLPDGKHAPYLDMSLPYAAGSLYSTVDDLLKWDAALHGGKVISADSLQKMLTPALNNYAYGLQVEVKDGRKTVSHGGGINGFNTMLLRLPEQGVVSIVLANQNTPATGQIAAGLARIALGETVAPRPLRTEVKLPANELDQVAGDYEIRPGMILKIWREGDRLMTQATNQSPIGGFAIAKDKFYVKAADAELEVERGQDGNPVAVTLVQGGRRQRAARK